MSRFEIGGSIQYGSDALRRFFAGMVEGTFQADLGVADPRLTDYLSDLLARFVRFDAIFRARDVEGRRLEELADLLAEAEARVGRPRRDLYRQIGDVALFWTGVYPEALRRLCRADRRDHLLDYAEQGRRAYSLAGEWDDEPYRDEAPVLRRLAEQFDLCRVGLHRVRAEWERA